MIRKALLILFASWTTPSLAAQYLINVNGYDQVVIPAQNGRQGPMITHVHSYPSRDQFAQMMIFINTTVQSTLLVHVKDTNPGFSQDWILANNITTAPCINGQWCLRVIFRSPVTPAVAATAYTGTTDWRIAAGAYKSWARVQPWYISHNKIPTGMLGHVTSCATNSYGYYTSNLAPMAELFYPKFVGCFMTQYRSSSFDVNYPNYSCSISANCPAWFQSMRNAPNVIALPYINGALWDQFNAGYSPINMCKDATGGARPYNASLRWVDPTLPSWPQTLRTAWENLKAADGSTPSGIYLDVIAATDPLVCYYGPTPDYSAWIRGTKAVLARFSDVVVMAEGMSEPYLPYVDIAYIYPPRTDVTGSIGLFGFLYSDIPGLHIVGQTSDTTIPARTLDTENALFKYQWDARNKFHHDAVLFTAGMSNDLSLLNSVYAKHFYKAWSNAQQSIP